MIVNCRRNIDDYKVCVFDLDGTLYDQKKLRLTMLKRLVGHFMLHPLQIKDLLLIKKFREVRDRWESVDKSCLEGEDASLEELQYKYMAVRMHMDTDRVREVITKWMYANPLDAVAASRDERLIGIMNEMMARGQKVCILSDYPTEDKMNAMNAKADAMYSTVDANIGELKPSPKGLKVIAEDMHAKPDDMLMIGDRAEKDGECAIGAGVDYIIIDRSISKRDYGIFEGRENSKQS